MPAPFSSPFVAIGGRRTCPCSSMVCCRHPTLRQFFPLLPPTARFLPTASFVPPAGDFLPKAAERFTVVSASFQPRCGMEIGTLPRNRLAASATGGASAIRNTVVSAGFQPLWGVKTGTLPRNRLAFSATGGASAIILAFSSRCAILNLSHIQRQSRDLRVAPMGA